MQKLQKHNSKMQRQIPKLATKKQNQGHETKLQK